MTKLTDEVTDEAKAGEEPKLAKETLKDLDSPVDEAQGVKGGATLVQTNDCNDGCYEAETM